MNKYEKQARKRSFLNGASDKTLPMKQRVGKTAGSTAILLVSGLGGGFIGAATGRWSLLIGGLMAGTGQFTGTPALTAFGLGMATSNIVSGGTTINGPEGEKKGLEKMKDRMKNYGQSLKEKLFLDKLTSKKKDTTSTETTTTTNGVGEVKYFNYPANADELDLSELERYERELQKSADKYKQENPSNVSGIVDMTDLNQRLI